MDDNVYSTDGETFHDYDTIFDELTGDYEPAKYEVYSGTPARAQHSEFVHIDNIVDLIKENAYDEYGEYAEDYLNELTRLDLIELKELIVSFLSDITGPIGFFGVKDVKKVFINTELELPQ